MNRNTQAHFANVPGIDISRSKFNRSFIHKTTASAGELVPCFVDCDIVPGDTVTMDQSEVIRMMTPLCPVMDDCFIDFYWFFVPNRLVWNHFKEFMGENTSAPWVQKVEYTIPQIEITNAYSNTISGTTYCTNVVTTGSVMDHMGLPINTWQPKGSESDPTLKYTVSALPLRSYALIWNEFFRDENLQNPVSINKDDTKRTLQNKYAPLYIADPDATQVTYAQLGGLPCLPVCKTHDYFTSALPGQLKASGNVTVPINGTAPIKALGIDYDEENKPETDEFGYATYHTAEGADPVWEGVSHYPMEYDDTGKAFGFYENTQLYADLIQATGTSVVALRQAFAIQKYLERDARSGTRYIESVLAHFGVRNPDYRVQRPEYLGGFRQNINMNQVVQTTPLEEGSTPLGTTGAYSVTSHKKGGVFSKSFTEHGTLMCLFCIRNSNTYQQGVNRMWLKKEKFDFYSPEFANLSEQYIKNMELFVQGTSKDEEAFGYQEAWAEMRYMPDIVSGEMRSDYSQSLDIWHYADDYTELPKLGDKWIRTDKSNIQRTLAVDNHDQFMLDMYFGAIYTRPMPVYSVPGLIDHH